MVFSKSYKVMKTEKYKTTTCIKPKVCGMCEKMIVKGDVKITDTGNTYFVMHKDCFDKSVGKG